MRPWTTTHDRNKGTAADYRTYLTDVEREIGVKGDPRGVHGYGSPLPEPLPTSPGGEPAGAQPAIDSNQPGDVLTDYFEQLAGIQDLDADGIADRREVLLGTNPLAKDSDADKLPDPVEIALGMDPRSQDTDFDGMFDFDEIRTGSDPLGAVGPVVPHMQAGTAQAGLAQPGAAQPPGAEFPRVHSASPIEGDQQLSVANNRPLSRTLPTSQSNQKGSALDHVTFGGKTVDRRTSEMLQEAERIANAQDASIGRFHLTQGSWSHAGASAGTHEGPGACDMYTAGYSDRQKDIIGLALRTVGFASWRRRASEGPWQEHWHAIAMGTKGLPQIAQNQVTSYMNGHNGLRGNGLDRDARPKSIVTWEQYEEQHGSESFDPYGQSGGADPNQADNGEDALTRYFEQLAGTGVLPDTDADGLPDQIEVAVTHTDPKSADFDKDQITDAMELSLGTNPLTGDTDKDHQKDGYEIRHGTDPLKPWSAFDQESAAAGHEVDADYDHHPGEAVDPG
jgi:hypothetical protein